MVPDSICIDFGVILGPVHFSFLGPKSSNFILFGLVSRSLFLSSSEPKFRRWGLQHRGFCKESIAKIDFLLKSFFIHFGIDFIVFGRPWEPFVWFFLS